MQSAALFCKLQNVETERYELSPEDVAQRLGVSRQTISRWAANGELPCLVTPGGWRRFRDSDVETFIAALAAKGGVA